MRPSKLTHVVRSRKLSGKNYLNGFKGPFGIDASKLAFVSMASKLAFVSMAKIAFAMASKKALVLWVTSRVALVAYRVHPCSSPY